MKNSNQLVSHLRSQSAFAPLNNLSCINAVKELLPQRLHRFILFGYIRHNILFFALNHPGAKQEFDNIISSIKTPLKFSQGTPTEVAYEERAHGEFTNEIQNEKLHTIMEEIRQIINEKS
jgi:hypothetical protein